jgi:hypothetical protein
MYHYEKSNEDLTPYLTLFVCKYGSVLCDKLLSNPQTTFVNFE